MPPEKMMNLSSPPLSTYNGVGENDCILFFNFRFDRNAPVDHGNCRAGLY